MTGENGVAHVSVQRDTKTIQLTVLKRDDIAGGSSIYEVINQYKALKDDECDIHHQNRRFDVSLLINGIPLIHIELKNRQHSYMDGFRQIKKYISEGKFTGVFSAIQTFVVSNAVDTKYFAAVAEEQLNEKFLSGWEDKENNPVSDYLKFASQVLKIPEANQIVMKYVVLDQEDKKLLLLRPYQIHSIEAVRTASRQGKSGYIWHTTGSGKTMTSYKTARNLLMDIPSIEKTIFLIDRKDLDMQTTQAFQSYANNDIVEVDETENVGDLINKLKNQNQDLSVYESEAHMLKVLDTILNKSREKLGFANGRGKTYERFLTVNSIQRAQAYYDLLKKVKNGETSIEISEETKRVLPDFPKFAITYSVSSNVRHFLQHRRN
ncbi:MAG: type I restriction endonuclease [Ruminococcus sp.]